MFHEMSGRSIGSNRLYILNDPRGEMSHLIIGAGNMGKGHGGILESLGEKVEYRDLEFDAKNHDWSRDRPDSVLICTPGRTHIDIANDIPIDIPIFCEKPLLTCQEVVIKKREAPTLVACNWRWCEHLDAYKWGDHRLDLYYPSNDPDRFLDLIHFSWMGKITFFKKCADCIGCTFTRHPDNFTVYIYFEEYQPPRLGWKAFHENGKCGMFERQMRHWLDVLVGALSINPFEQAEKDTRQLIALFERPIHESNVGL